MLAMWLVKGNKNGFLMRGSTVQAQKPSSRKHASMVGAPSIDPHKDPQLASDYAPIFFKLAQISPGLIQPMVGAL